MNVFLIDADNLNSGTWIDEAFSVLEEIHGDMPVRRAYGSAENLKALADTLRTWAVRPYVNLSLSKNTTDIALAVDAMAFACQTPAPRLIVIGSGDADFAPLVVRLRERGIRVVCVSERSKMAREAVCAYDQVILVGAVVHQHDADVDATAATPTRKVAAKKAPARKTAPLKAAVVKTPAKKATAKKAVRKVAASDTHSAANEVVTSVVAAKPVLPATESALAQMSTLSVDAILAAVPALLTGQPEPLAAVAKALLDAKLRGKNMTATKLLKKFPIHFALLPPEKPRTVQYSPAPDLR